MGLLSVSKSDGRNQFLNKVVTGRMIVRSWIQRVIAWFLAVISAIGGGSSLLSPEHRREFWENLGMMVSMLAIAGVLFFLSYRNRRRVALARDCAALLPTGGGSIGIPALAERFRKPPEKLFLTLDWMFRKKVFRNCVLDVDRETPCITVPVVEAQRSMPELVTVKCPHCSGLTKVPLGGLGKCEWCDSPVRGDAAQD